MLKVPGAFQAFCRIVGFAISQKGPNLNCISLSHLQIITLSHYLIITLATAKTGRTNYSHYLTITTLATFRSPAWSHFLLSVG